MKLRSMLALALTTSGLVVAAPAESQADHGRPSVGISVGVGDFYFSYGRGVDYFPRIYATPTYVPPTYVVPTYVVPRYSAPRYVAPTCVSPSHVAPCDLVHPRPHRHPHHPHGPARGHAPYYRY